MFLGLLGASRGNLSLVAPMAWHPDNQNELIVCDLGGHMKMLENLDSYALRTRLYIGQNMRGNEAAAVPIKLVHINQCPVLAPVNTMRSKTKQ